MGWDGCRIKSKEETDCVAAKSISNLKTYKQISAISSCTGREAAKGSLQRRFHLAEQVPGISFRGV